MADNQQPLNTRRRLLASGVPKSLSEQADALFKQHTGASDEDIEMQIKKETEKEVRERLFGPEIQPLYANTAIEARPKNLDIIETETPEYSKFIAARNAIDDLLEPKTLSEPEAPTASNINKKDTYADTLPMGSGTDETGTDKSTGTDEIETNKEEVPPEWKYYDPKEDEEYLAAMRTLDTIKANKPTYTSAYNDDIEAAYNAIVNREKFSYDVNSDALYAQYADKYIQQGQLAMLDTMGQASLKTGGYGNSYAQNVGQQAYQQYLTGLNDQIPELYQLALNRYLQEGEDMKLKYSMLADMEDTAYDKYINDYSTWLNEVALAKDDVADAYNSGVAENNANYQRKGTEHDRIADLITNGGYTPSEEEREQIGMSDNETLAYLNWYYSKAANNKGKGSETAEEDSTGFTGTTYNAAHDYLIEYGIPEDSSFMTLLMTQADWAKNRKVGQAKGEINDAMVDATYSEYVQHYVEAALHYYENGEDFVAK